MLAGGLNTGNYSLSTPSGEIVEAILNLLSSYLQSNAGVSLDSSFFIKIRVLSIDHSDQKERQGVMTRRGPWKRDLWTGCGPSVLREKYPSSRWFTDAPMGYKGNETAFANKCVLFAMVLGLAKHSLISLPYKSLLSKEKILKTNMGKRLEKAMKKVAYDIDIPFDGPHELNETLEKFTNYYDIGVIVHKYPNMLNFHMTSPNLFDADRPYIRLLLEENNVGFHVTSVVNLQAFKKYSRGTICPVCYKHIKNAKTIHRCRKWKTCIACHRFISKSRNPNLDIVCQEFMEGETVTLCPKCQISSSSTECASAHKKICGIKFYCFKCSQMVHRNMDSSLEKAKERHELTCGENLKTCQSCYATIDENSEHQCLLKLPLVQKMWNRVGFLTFLTHEEKVLLAHMVIEEGRRGNFVEKMEISWKSNTISSDAKQFLYFKYEPPEFDVPLFQSTRKVQFNQEVSDQGWFDYVTKQMQKNGDPSPLEKMLQWFFQSEMCKNSTILLSKAEDLVSTILDATFF